MCSHFIIKAMNLIAFLILCVIDSCLSGCDCGRGGLCLKYGASPSEGISANPCHCDTISKGIFKAAATHCDTLVDNFCQSSPCQNRAKCYNGFGTFICICRHGDTVYAGHMCQHKVPRYGQNSLFITLWYPITEQKRWVPILVAMKLSSEIQFVFEFEYERKWIATTKECGSITKSEAQAKCGRRSGGADCSILKLAIDNAQYLIECVVVLPYMSDRAVYIAGVLGPVGYYHEVKFRAVEDDIVHLSANYRVFLETGDMMRKCPYKVKLSGCGESPTTAKQTMSSDSLKLSASSPFTDPKHVCPIKSKPYKWFLSSIKQYGNPQMISPSNQTIIVVPSKFGFNTGLMVVSVEITFQGLTEDETVMGMCFVSLMEKKFSVNVYEAYLRYTCGVKTSVKVIPTLADLRYPESELKFKWICSEEICEGANTESKILLAVTTVPCTKSYSLKLAVSHVPSRTFVQWEGTLVFTRSNESDINLVFDPDSAVVNPTLPLTITAINSWRQIEKCVWYPEIHIQSKCGSGVPSHVLMIPPNTLEPGRNHSFRVFTERDSKNFTVSTATAPHNFTCSMYPNSGLRLHVDVYNLTCSAETTSPPLTFYVYEGENEELTFISQNPRMEGILINSAPVKVEVEDSIGMKSSVEIPVEVEPYDPKKLVVTINERVKRLPLLIHGSDYLGVADEIDKITKLMWPDFPRHLQHTLMKYLAQIQECHWEMCIAKTINSIRRLTALKSNLSQSGVDDFVLLGGGTIYRMTLSLDGIGKMQYGAYRMISLLSCIHSAARQLMDFVDPLLQHATIDEDIRQMHYRKVEQGNAYARQAIAELGLFITNHIPHPAFPFLLTSDSMDEEETMVISHLPEYINCVGQLNTTDSYFRFTRTALVQLEKSDYMTSITIVHYKKNVFWWSEKMSSSMGGMVEVHFHGKKPNEKTWKQLAVPTGSVEMLIFSPKSKSRTTEGVAYEPRNVTEPRAHRFIVPRGHGALLLKFPKELFGHIRLAYSESSIPMPLDRRLLLNHSLILYTYYAHYRTNVYIGISSTKGQNQYSFNVSLVQCVTGSERMWKSEYCIVTGSPANDWFLCECEHLSLLSVKISEPEVQLISMLNLYLYTTNECTYYAIVLLIAILIVLYSTALCLAWKGKPKRCAIFMEDNWPGEGYPYLVAVYTGGRCMSGTSSHVAIRLIGEQAMSRVHILQSDDGSIPLAWGQDSWFILFTAARLGRIRHIEMWHDDKGWKSDWYCTRVIVWDTLAGDRFIFYIKYWMTYTNLYKTRDTTFFFEVYDKQEKKIWWTYVVSHAYAKLREEHHWVSVALLHPRSRYTLLDRFVLVNIIVVVAFASTMAYYVDNLGPADRPARMTVTDLYVSIKVIVILSLVVTFPALLLSIGRNKLIAFTPSPPAKDLLRSLCIHPISYIPVMTEDKYEREKRKWNRWILFAYAVSAMIICASAAFILKSGTNFSENRSLIWFLVSLVAICGEAFIVNPIQVLITSVVVAYVSKTSAHDVAEFNILPIEDSVVNKNVQSRLDSALHHRIQPMYKPPLSSSIQKRATRNSRRDRFDVFFITVLLLVLTPSLVFFLKKELRYHKYLEFSDMFVNKRSSQDSFVMVRNRSQYFDRLRGPVMLALHRYTWYNGEPLKSEWKEAFLGNDTWRPTTKFIGFCSDYSTTLVGVPQLRQQRIVPDSNTTVASEFRRYFQYAHGEMNEQNQDTKTYLPKWETLKESERYYRTYRYSFANETRAATFYGVDGQSYKSGGYVEHLHWSLGLSLSILVDLELDNWLDNLTRSIFFTFNLFSVFEERVSYVTIITECLPSGVYRSRIMTDSASISAKRLPLEHIIAFIVLGIAIVVTLHLIRTLIIISKNGFYIYLRSVSWFVDIIFILVGYAFVAALINRYFHYFAALEEIESTTKDRYTPLHWRFNQNDIALAFFGAFSLSSSALGTISVHDLIGFEAISIALARTRALLIVYGGLNLLTIYAFLELFYFGSGDTSNVFFMIYFKDSTAIHEVLASHFADILLVSVVAFLVLTHFNVAILVPFYAEAALLIEPKKVVFQRPISNLRPRVLAIQTLKSKKTVASKKKWFKSQLEREEVEEVGSIEYRSESRKLSNTRSDSV